MRMFMYICKCVYVCVCLCVWTCVYRWVFVQLLLLYVYTSMNVAVAAIVYGCLQMCTCMHVSVCVYPMLQSTQVHPGGLASKVNEKILLAPLSTSTVSFPVSNPFRSPQLNLRSRSSRSSGRLSLITYDKTVCWLPINALR